MENKKTASEVTKKVYNYIIKKTEKGYTSVFNPLDITLENIAKELRLDEEEVDEALNELSPDENWKISRINSIKPTFEIWLPNTKGGKNIKDFLCGAGLAKTGNLNILYSFLFLVAVYIFIFVKPYLGNILKITTFGEYFIWAIIFTLISIPFGNFISRKLYQGNLLLRRVEGRLP